jgi:4'-phosphopantetheinyl transferase
VIHIYYTCSSYQLNNPVFEFYLQQLPHRFQENILKYRKWQDRQRGLFGKLLLKHALASLELTKYSLHNLRITALDRPYFDDSIDFNISHSGNFIICAINTDGRIGVDVEEVKDVPLQDFLDNFSENEWCHILNSSNKLYSFYNYWTKKEAFLKAIGMGLNVPLNKIEVVSNKIVWNNSNWYLHPLNLNETHLSHFATLSANPQVVLQKANFE